MCSNFILMSMDTYFFGTEFPFYFIICIQTFKRLHILNRVTIFIQALKGKAAQRHSSIARLTTKHPDVSESSSQKQKQFYRIHFSLRGVCIYFSCTIFTKLLEAEQMAKRQLEQGSWCAGCLAVSACAHTLTPVSSSPQHQSPQTAVITET